jgi:hypothetical protein
MKEDAELEKKELNMDSSLDDVHEHVKQQAA